MCIRRIVVLAIVVTVLAVVLTGMAAGDSHGTEHTACTTISSSGHHVLTSDVTDASTAHCIEITTSNVTFDGHGHVIDGVDGDQSSRGINVEALSPVTNVTIRNVTVTNWETAVYLDDASNGSVRNVTASNSTLTGFNLYHSRNNTIQNVTVTGSDDKGIYFTSRASDNIVTNSTVVDTTGSPVFMDSWSGDLPENRFETLDIGDSTAPNTTLSFTGRAVALDSVDTAPADPAIWTNVSRFFNVTTIAAGGYLNVSVEYDESDMSNPDGRVSFLEHDGTAWTELGGSTRDESATTVSANLTSIPVSGSYPVSNWTSLGVFADSTPETNPDGAYNITSVEELQWMNTELDADYVLGNDIDASVTESWNEQNGAYLGFEPIGDRNDPFLGTFDGANHTIEGLSIHRAEGLTPIGLFGQVGNDSVSGEVQDVSLADANVTGEPGEPSDYVGALAGSLENGTVTNASAGGTVSGGGRVGGLLGFNDGIVRNSAATGTVTGASGKVGGLVGTNHNDGIVADSYATATVSSEQYYVGGLVGNNYAGTITDSYATGTVSSDLDYVGGLVGDSYYATIEDSYATGTVSGNDTVGGLVGLNDDGSTVNGSYATGSASGNGTVGGLVGDNANIVADSYWDDQAATVTEGGTQVDAQGAGAGNESGMTGLTTAEMIGVNATVELDQLDFGGTWHATASYPALAWQDTDPLFAVSITETTAPIETGETLSANVSVTNWGASGTLPVTLTDTGFSDTEQDETTVTLPAGTTNDTITLEWEPTPSDTGTGAVAVASPNTTDTATITVEAPPIVSATIENTGGVHGIGIPGPINGTIVDLFPNGTAGTNSLYTYEDGQWLRVSDLNQPLSAMDTLVVITSGSGPEAIDLEFAFDTTTTVTNHSLEAGWNLVPGTAYVDAEASFGTESTLVVHDRYGAPLVAEFPAVAPFEPYVLGSTDWGETAPMVSPFGTYFVYADAPSDLPLSVSDIDNRDDLETSLTDAVG